MARINVEDELFTDKRFINLMMKLGSIEMALGALVRCWVVAQRYYKTSDRGIPLAEWNEQELKTEIIDVGLARIDGDFVVIAGGQKHFGWLRDRIDAGFNGGKKSGISRREIIEKFAKQNEAKRSKRKQNEPSSSSSSSSSLSFSSSKKENIRASGGENLRNIWNSQRGPLSECRELSDKRRKAARALLLLKPDESYWEQVVQKIAASHFCTGGGSQGWRADFDWFLKPDTHLRVMEGKYDDAKTTTHRKMSREDWVKVFGDEGGYDESGRV